MRGDSRTVQELLGHASVETTQIYTHVMHPASPRLRRAGKPGLGVRSLFGTHRAGLLDQRPPRKYVTY